MAKIAVEGLCKCFGDVVAVEAARLMAKLPARAFFTFGVVMLRRSRL